jgi:CDP-glucose 4,6-dehydratase|tara:strand:- start:915 stop:1973 length:1059 start_codon:yes stop_codon:yes gene_type:complete
VSNLKDFYKNKRVFITGHTGFKGTWLTACLLKFGSKIMGYSKPDDRLKIYKSMCHYNKVKNAYADILDYKFLRSKMISFKPQIIFHLAAQSLVSESYKFPMKTVATNTIGTTNILNISREIKSLNSLVIITSDKCYLNKELTRGYKESDILGGEDLYSASKASAEIIFKAYSESFFKFKKNFGYATARAGNVIGGGDWSKNRIVPDCVRSIQKNKTLIIRNPKSTRPWQHVLEPLSGYLLLAKKICENKKKYNGSWNFGPSSNETMKVKNIVELFFKSLKSKTKIIFKKGNFKEANLLKLNSSKGLKKLKWQNNWSMRSSIVKTAMWYNHFLKKNDLKEITYFQIKEYFKIK